jgi:hypothetical protein
MAAPTLPTLTWKRSNVQTITTATTSEVISSIYTLISGSNYWYPALVSTASAAAMDYLVIRPRLTTDTPAASVQPAMTAQRIIIAGQGSGGTPSENSMGLYTTNTNDITQPNTEQICVNYIPEGRSGSADIAATPDARTPYGNRATGYFGCAADIDGSDTYKTWLIESEEVLTVCIENYSATNAGMGFVAGPLLVAPSTGSNDVDVDDRIYGLISFGTFFTDTWQQSETTAGWTDSGAVGCNTHHVIIFDPSSTSTGSSPSPTSPQLTALRTQVLNTTAYSLVTGDGAFVGIPINYFGATNIGTSSMSPSRFLGTLRQIRYVRDFPARIIIQDGGGTEVAFAWSNDPAGDKDAVGFTNS